ncbi:protein YIPF5 [Diachasma alloeum]|uniref:protein YIPF5 n=1 Tax=Diachasma alloeum TaxID=454923 RepID=UPI000738171E|nr:protein YIPF5 [Diachasma alloeum]
MSGYTGQDNYWGQPPQGQYNFDPAGFGQPNPQFDFQSYGDEQTTDYTYSQKSYLDPTQGAYGGDMTYASDDFGRAPGFGEEEDEPPLLEELGIDPDRIMQKTLAVLNPFHRRGQIDDANYLLQDADLAGPVAFCLILAGFLLLAGSKAHFGYVYGLAVTSCLLMYILQSLMSSTGNITLSSVASVLGYCLLPVVVLAGVSIFTTLKGPIGMAMGAFAVAWATVSASRLFSAMSGEEKQRLLIAYPCLLLYGVFTLIVIF